MYNNDFFKLNHCVTRKRTRRIPPCVTKDKLKLKKAHIETRVTTKSEVLEGDPKRTNLIESSLYDTTPIHCISIVSEDLKWVTKEKECFNIDTSKVKILRFLRMNYINNNEMGGVDISNNIGNYYRIYIWLSNRKWKWYILFWAVGVILMNSYTI